jgi:hypothetical protein
LEDYAAGKLNHDLAERIRVHLEHCPGCNALYENILSSRVQTAQAVHNNRLDTIRHRALPAG